MTTSVREVPIDPHLAKKIQGAADKATSWTAVRDDLIREAIDAGASYREVAEHAGVSHMTVKRIAQNR